MPQPASVAPGTRKLSEVARRVVRPSTAVDSAWFDLDSTFIKLGIPFDAWQDGAGQLILATDENGKYSCTVGGACLSLPRQVGKTYLIGSLAFALAVKDSGLLIIWTAHHADTAAETFKSMVAMTQRQKIAPHVRKTYDSDNHKEIVFRNGSRILFGARARGFGRGIPGVSVLICDEAQILPERAMDDMLATLNTAKNGLPIFLGTPPTPNDPSDAFRRMRDEALSGESDDIVWIECAADPDADPDDRDQWGKGNPSYPHRTPIESMLRMRKRLTPESWMREGLGIWDEDGADVFAGAWPSCLTAERPTKPPTSIAVACSVELSQSAIVAAVDEGDRVYIRPLQYGPGTQWVVDAAAGYAAEFDATVVVDGGGPAKVLVPNLELAVSDLRVLSTEDVKDACAEMFTLVQNEGIAHRGDDELDTAVRGAVKRPLGDRWAWGRRKSASDVSALEAATFAAWDALHSDSGPNVFIARPTTRPVLVCGPLAESYAAEHHPDAEVWTDAKPWQRDRYRIQHDARVIFAAETEDDYMPSKYGREELMIVGGER